MCESVKGICVCEKETVCIHMFVMRFFGDVELQPGAASEAGESFYCGKNLDRTTLSRGDEKVTKCAARLVLVYEKGNTRIVVFTLG